MKNRLTEKQKKALAVLGTTAGVYLALKYVLRLFFPVSAVLVAGGSGGAGSCFPGTENLR